LYESSIPDAVHSARLLGKVDRQIRFDHVPLHGGGAALVELVLDPADGKEVNVQFRDVAVAR
jgi:hypothetical protein